MKKAAFLLMSAWLVSACNNTTNQLDEKTDPAEEVQAIDYQIYGDTISPEGAIPANELYAMMEGRDSLPLKVEGNINAACQVKGCWMKMDVGNGREMHITFKDYGFFVPKNSAGKSAILEGYATIDTMDVAYLKHLAEDAGKSEEEIAAITEPEISLTYVASGVIMK